MARTLGLVMVVVVAAACSTNPNNNLGDDTGDAIDAPPGVSIDAPKSTPSGAAGSSCSCDADCGDEGANAGVCIYGVCMTRASGACASGGSQSECPTGSRCWNLDGWDGGPLCWPDCSAHTCSGTCDGDGSCAPAMGSDCDATCGAACSCTATSCGAGNSCVAGECVPDTTGDGPGPGPGPTCANLPARDCTGTTCGSMVSFNPRTTAAWDDYAINGETATNQYRSFLRKELMMLVSYATSRTACKAAGWTPGNGGALGLGDMSEANGAIPGTSIGSPGHPAGTHVNGFDIDLGYFQVGTANNQLRPICEHSSNGADQFHCVAPPTNLDVWRHAMFLGSVFESTRTRVVGVDGKVGPLLISAMNTLCSTGWLTATACGNITLAYEVTDTGQGWFFHHHHHSHISLKPAAFAADDLACASGSCNSTNAKRIERRPSSLHRVRR